MARNTRSARRARVPKAEPQGAGKLVITNKYDAAGMGRRMKGWNPPSSGPNRAIVGLQKIRDRARDAIRNDWAGESIAQKWATNLIGIGISPRFQRLSKAHKQILVDLWDDFVKVSDADGVLNFYGQQTLGVRSWAGSGEVFVRRRRRPVAFGLPVPLQVQLLESDMCPLLDADTWPGLPVGHRIRQGIELNRYGRRTAYWMYPEHPGDGMHGNISVSTNLIRIPASEIKHVFEPLRPGQLRGVSMLAPTLARLRSIADFDDAVLERQKLANLFTAFITWTMQGMSEDDVDPLTGLPIGALDRDGSSVGGLEPGLTQELEPGQNVVFSNPPEAGTTFSDYMRTQHLGTAAAGGLPYELFSGDIKEVSDRTLRVIVNEFRRLAEQRQWQVWIPMMCQPVHEWFVDAAVLAGKIPASIADDAKRVEWAPHGWAYIHPVQDVQGKKLEVEAGFRSRSSVIGERGDDPEAVDAERAEDKKREDELDLTVEPTNNKTDPNKKTDPDEDGIDDDEYPPVFKP